MKPRQLRSPAIAISCAAGLLTSGVVSWLTTPDGNLVVTLVPGVTVGLIVLGLARWFLRRHAG